MLGLLLSAVGLILMASAMAGSAFWPIDQAAVAALLGRISEESGVTVLMVAHNVNPIAGYLDRVVYLARGQAAAGTPDEVITPETLSRLYGTPIDVLRTQDGHVVVVGQPGDPHGDVHAHLVQ